MNSAVRLRLVATLLTAAMASSYVGVPVKTMAPKDLGLFYPTRS